VQVDPIKPNLKPNLKPPGNKRLKQKHDVLLSNFALKFNLRRYTTVKSSIDPLCSRSDLQQHGREAQVDPRFTPG